MNDDRDNEKKKKKDQTLSKELLEALVEESHMLDDHGPVIIGDRKTKIDFEKKN